ncbi:MAG: hypothetical protein ACD_7C00020G0027 [uncultured bacterium]|nr:MAG: hypothetical protein ACD_7C00020G0027 [uncultured bacterium]HBR79837.1 hypothetical protein [Candidatus Moranbacteria bacterium]
MDISQITRRNIIDALKIKGISWNGKLSEVEFLKRIYNLQALPSTDIRHSDMEGDIYRHRVMNDDWEEDWVFDDSSLKIMDSSDDIFIKFICEMLHPLVRDDKKEVNEILDIFNKNLKIDGYNVIAEKYISGRPIFNAVKESNCAIEIENRDKIGRKFIVEQLDKCDKKIREKDYDGAITNARSLVEDVITKDIYKQITGEELKTKGDLVKDYNEMRTMLNLATRKDIDDSFKQITSGVASIINGIASIRNKMSDGHSREEKPLKHHAKFIVNSAKMVVEFLYDVMDYQKKRKNKLYAELLALPHIRYGEGKYFKGKYYNLESRDEIIRKAEIKLFLDKCDSYLMFILKEELIAKFDVDSFRNADKFLVSLIIIFDILNEKDITRIYDKHKYNNQMSVISFIRDVYKIKPESVKRKDILLLIKNEG